MSRFLSGLGRATLILAAVFCALGTVISAYGIPVSLPVLAGAWAAAAALFSALGVRWGTRGALAGLVPVLGLGYILRAGLAAGGRWVAFHVTDECSQWLSVPVLFRDAEASGPEIIAFLAAAGALLAFLLALTLCLQHGTAFLLPLTLPFVLIAAAVMDFAENPWFLLGLVATWLTAIVSEALQGDEGETQGSFVFPALALAMLVMTVAYFVSLPGQGGRNSRVTAVEDWIKDAIRDGHFGPLDWDIGWPEAGSNYWHFNTEQVSVADAGRRTVNGRSLLEVNSDTAGTFYLRGYSMRTFDGRSWVNSDAGQADSSAEAAEFVHDYILFHPESAPVTAAMTIMQTGDLSNVIYTPYYTFDVSDTFPTVMNFGYVEGNVLLYAESTAPAYRSARAAQVQTTYTSVDPLTAQSLRALAAEAGIDSSASRAEIADAVAAYVSGAARYTLDPAEIPESEDFALYFLQTSREGYCVHFATAATLMLRALDVPARFTSGFYVTVPERSVGGTVIVTDKEAHAWVEVYYDDIGWVPLEATPSAGDSGVPAGTAHAAPPETQAPTKTPNPVQPSLSPSDDAGNGSGQPQNNEPDVHDGEAEEPGPGIKAAAVVIFGALLAVAALILRRRMAQVRRARIFAQADTNAAVLCAWGYISRLHGKRSAPPEDIEELAMKARFSRHVLSQQERAAVVDYAQRLADDTDRRCGRLERLRLRYIRALY